MNTNKLQTAYGKEAEKVVTFFFLSTIFRIRDLLGNVFIKHDNVKFRQFGEPLSKDDVSNGMIMI